MSKKKVGSFTRVLCLLLAILMLMGTFMTVIFAAEIKYVDDGGKTVKLNDFLDTKGHWAQSIILKWADYEMISGYQGKFMPNDNMKRADVALVLDRMMGLNVTSYNFFNDLPNESYYRDALLRNVAAGYFSGTGNNLVNPLGNTTREEIAVILCRVFKIDISNTGNTKFIDDNQISSWARPSVLALSKLGYMNGDGNRVNPKGKVTRAEIIQLFDNIAEVYIPKKDSTSQGNTFSLTANRNFVVARNVELLRSTVGRDLITTQSVRSINLDYTTVKGRIVILGKTTVNLENSEIKTVELYEKSTINGVSKCVSEVYVSESATESILDTIPDKITLEPGVRVKIEGTMYENTSTKNKVYNGLDIKADIAAEQGFVTGGPKIQSVKTLHTYDNNFTFQEVKIQIGETPVSEVGVIYINDANTVPTLSNYSHKQRHSKSYTSPVDINVGKISGERTYRVYAVDTAGLISYSVPVTIKAYDFDIELALFDVSYPEILRAEILFNGNNIPEISNIKVSYNTTSEYKEVISLLNMSEAEVGEQDKNKVIKTLKRYIGELKTPASGTDAETGERIYIPPTEFGYVITFRDGSVVRKFPVLTNALPQGISPVETLTTGNARFSTNNKLEITNNYIRTRHVEIQEAGVIYREVPKETPIREPEVGTNGWKAQQSYVNVGLKDTAYYSTTVPLGLGDSETHFAAYVKTSNGYFYGKVKKVQNNWIGTEKGPKIVGSPEVLVLDETKALLTIPVQLTRGLDLDNVNSIINFKDKDGKPVYKYDGRSLNSAKAYLEKNQTLLVLVFDGLNANQLYDCTLQLFGNDGEASNAVNLTINTKDLIPMSLTKTNSNDSETTYNMYVPTFNNSMILENGKVTVQNNTNASGSVSTSTTPWKLTLRNLNTESTTVFVDFNLYIVKGIGNLKSVEFTRSFSVQK